MKLPIYLIESSSRQCLAETFMRFQEYYESPVFRGRPFSVEEFSAWYASEYGAFTYARDWSGFNIPSAVLEPFRRGDFNPLTDKEKKLLELLNGDDGPFYVIGATSKDDWFKDTIRHEFVHGAFATNKDYREHVIRLIQLKKPEKIKKVLAGMGYGSNVLEDELNAYLLTEPQTLASDVSLRDGTRWKEMLDEVFCKYFGFSVVDSSIDAVMKRVNRFSI